MEKGWVDRCPAEDARGASSPPVPARPWPVLAQRPRTGWHPPSAEAVLAHWEGPPHGGCGARNGMWDRWAGAGDSLSPAKGPWVFTALGTVRAETTLLPHP